MRIHTSVLVLLTITTLLACNNKKTETTTSSEEKEMTVAPTKLSEAEILLNEAIQAHGGDLYDTANYSFVFRENTYTFKNDGQSYEYTKTAKKEDSTTIDVLKNGVFSRTVNNEPVTLSEKKTKSATGAINSVIYFATLPHKLNDASVLKEYLGETTIKGQTYAVLGITFKQEGGGEDFDDEFHYWINSETKKIDYLAYNYKVNKGGVRFRSAYNRSVIDGITFQDYINYKVEVGTPLLDIPSLYEAGKLTELSKIETEQILNLNNK
ncbi:DUF6503 family protein [Ulvibacter litoralis]|uniref:Deoxyribose-phosphate aldolase n=1 Tax=Ulvibacter litoralis TaxID=227084 RepID=A0A1G7FK73_9FLAO|nr:DUF6503 family protein [Ulvibacter litoralis]GHC50805.1 hypothetical protein GCM10008083_13020 [Ulvibacter litoralis]SDE76284.1 hypothetical protein SAMN05421855_102606 [Ulvibacter litoralis]